MSEPTDPIAQLEKQIADAQQVWNPRGVYLSLEQAQQFADALRAQRTEGRQPSKPEDAPDPPWTLFLDLKLTGNGGGLIRDHHASRPVTDGAGFHAMYQRWQEITEATIERTEGRPPEAATLQIVGALDTGSLSPIVDNGTAAERQLAAGGRSEGRATWQPIETAPKDGREVLIQVERRAGIPHQMLVGHYQPGGHCIEDHPAIDEGWYFWNGCMFDRASKPEKWMPLPSTSGENQ